MKPILIAGGGIGGIATALCLRARGVPFELFEQAEAFREVGAGIQLSCNVMRIFVKLGLGPELERIGVRPKALEVRSWQSGERILWTPLGEVAEKHFGAPYLHAHRAEVLDVMARALGTANIHLGSKVKRVDQDAGGASLTLEDGTTWEGAAVIGADGIHSIVRDQLFGKGTPRFSGNVAWRGTMPAEAVADLKLELRSNCPGWRPSHPASPGATEKSSWSSTPASGKRRRNQKPCRCSPPPACTMNSGVRQPAPTPKVAESRSTSTG